MSNKQKLVLAVGLLLFALLKVAMLLWWQQGKNQQVLVQTLSCDVVGQGCAFADGAVFRLRDVGRANEPFSVEMVGLSPQTQAVSVSFAMRDMDMGFNRVELVKRQNGMWRADKVFLPLCSSSRRDWLVIWTVDGVRFQAAFHTK